MASAVMHLCIAKKVNDYLKQDIKILSLGAVAPDISKQIGQTKDASHFLSGKSEDFVPNVDAFLAKYREEITKPFELGYLIHLLTDMYWFRDFIPNYIKKYEKDNNQTGITYTGLSNLIYNDYTNLNSILIDEYNPEIDVFMNPIDYPKTKIKEIPVNALPLIVDKMSFIIMESQEEKNLVFDLTDIKNFIEECSERIIEDLQDILY